MHILKIIIDGFKSYGERTEIGPFDPHFNAITGFNGSGKSNILDAICFVLGTTSWSQMRANNSMELIYKQGTGSVIKASVSIIFDNTDKSRSPMQYVTQDFITVTRQITTRTIKYKINGKTSQVSEVHNLFHSVQLNINNPHFLIMQGHISKVLNMKPKEILSLLEEASGTRMFESKKASVRKKIEGHENKVQGIDRTLNETINPTLERLNRDKAVYIRYMNLKKKVTELDHNVSVCQYALIKLQIANLARKMEDEDREPKWTEEKLNSQKDELESLQVEYNTLKMGEINSNQELQEIESKRNQLTLDFKSKELEHSRCLKDIKRDEEKIESLDMQNSDLCKVMEVKREDLNVQMRILNDAKRNLLAMETDDPRDKAYSRKSMESKAMYIEQVSKLGIEISDIERSIEEVEGKMARNKESFGDESVRRYDEVEDEIGRVRDRLKAIGEEMEFRWSEINEMRVLDEEECIFRKGGLGVVEGGVEGSIFKLSLESRVRLRLMALELLYGECEERLRRYDGKEMTVYEEEVLRRTNFEYDDGLSSGLDGGRVVGRVCRLVRVKEEDKCRALTVAGGNSWSYVVVGGSSEAMLLTKLARSRTTFIMLDEIGDRMADERVVEESKKVVGEGNVWMAESLVEIDPRYRPVLFSILGNTLVTRDGSMAHKITFEHKIARCVSMAGDIYDLHGTLTGGEEKERREPLLLVLNRLRQREVERGHLRGEKQRLNEQINGLRGLYNEWTLLKSKAEGLSQRLGSIENPHQVVQNLERMLRELRDLREEKMRIKNTAESFLESFSSKGDRKNAPRDDRQIRQATADVKNAQIAVVRLQAELEQLENDVVAVNQARESALQSIESKRTARSQLSLEMDYLKKKLLTAEQSLQGLIGGHQDHQRSLARLKSQIDEKNALIVDWQRKMRSHASQIAEERVRLEKLQTKLNEFKKRQDLEKEAAKYPNLEHELLSKISNDSQQLEAAKEQIKKISFSINSKASQLADQFEKEVEDLKKKKEIIKDDRNAIEATIREFDQRKLSTLQMAFESVSGDFRDIFLSLSLGMNACLRMVGPAIEEGLEIRVELGSRTANLSELSGGQRSLLALSLVLALLKYNPAPMYILDEVDSALDNSNTQNIGLIFKEKFPQSQFVVVSLKQDLLASSNVLFTASYNAKTGCSMVTRTTPNEK